MCFHNSLSVESQKLKNRYNAGFKEESNFKPIYHQSAFESKLWPIITNSEFNEIQMFNWGLVPSWTENIQKAKEISKLTYNAKSETVFEKKSFKDSIVSRRCLIPSTGFFEWQHLDKMKIPWFIQLKELEIFSMAGIWSVWEDKINNTLLNSFSILTCEANLLMEKIHNTKKRMPLILTIEQESEWLKSDLMNFTDYFRPISDKLMEAYTVGPLISKVKHEKNRPEVQSKFEYFVNGSLF